MPGGRVQSVERAIEILYCFNADTTELGVSEIGRRLKIHKSTTHRLLVSLEAQGLVRFDPQTQRYALGLGVMRLSSALLHGRNVASISLPYMRMLRDISGETACLHVRVDDERICIQQVESRQELFLRSPLGKKLPLHAGASGRILLTFLPESEIDRIVGQSDLIALTARTITDEALLRSELLRTRNQRYAMTSEERVQGAASLALPIRDPAGEVVAALSLFGPVSRLTSQRMAELLPLVRQAADNISSEMGYSGSSEMSEATALGAK